MDDPERFEALLEEGRSEPVEGWDFSWFDGRATEERPPWGYARMLASRMAGSQWAFDIQTGGGEVLAELLAQVTPRPSLVVASESWQPNLELARARLGPLGVAVVDVDDDADLPFPDATFDLVASRHPTNTRWDEVARVLRPGGRFLSQQVGAGSNRELTEAMMGPQPVSARRTPQLAVEEAERVGLRVLDVRQATLRTVFFDVGAVVYFLRKVCWTVPGFTVEGCREQLALLHDRITFEGAFVSQARRFLIEVEQPAEDRLWACPPVNASR